MRTLVSVMATTYIRTPNSLVDNKIAQEITDEAIAQLRRKLESLGMKNMTIVIELLEE